MGLGKQAKTLGRGQVDAMLAYLSTTRHAEESAHLLAVGESRAEGQGDREADVADGKRLYGPGRVGNLLARLRQQGQIRTQDPTERGRTECADRLSGGSATFRAPNRHGPFRPTRHPDGTVSVDFGAGRRQPIQDLVWTTGVRWLLEPLGEANVHHQRSPEDLDGRRVP
jgi:hypothetical protein